MITQKTQIAKAGDTGKNLAYILLKKKVRERRQANKLAIF